MHARFYNQYLIPNYFVGTCYVILLRQGHFYFGINAPAFIIHLFGGKFYETYLYSEERLYRRCEDYEIFMRAYAQGVRGANVQKPLLAYYSDRKTGKKMTLPHRLKGVVVRAKGFAELRLFPRAFWYIWKPIISGIIPQKVIRKIKNEEIE